MSVRELNPYNPPTSFVKKASRKSLTACFLVPSLIGCVFGGATLGPYVGTSIGDPFGESRGAAVGGFAGLLLGFVLYGIIRGRINRRSLSADSAMETTSEH